VFFDMLPSSCGTIATLSLRGLFPFLNFVFTVGDIFAHKRQVLSDGGANLVEGVEVAFKLQAPRPKRDAPQPSADPDAEQLRPEARAVRVVRCADAGTLEGVLQYLDGLLARSTEGGPEPLARCGHGSRPFLLSGQVSQGFAVV
jgi:hypothetical protein